MNDTGSHLGTSAWGRIRPVLDGVLNEMPTGDRDVLLLHYLQGCPLSEVAARWKLEATDAQVRLSSALDVLRARLEERGIPSTRAELASCLSAHGRAAIPAGLRAAIVRSALEAMPPAAPPTVLAPRRRSLLRARVGWGLVAAAAVLTPLLVQHRAIRRLRTAETTARQRIEVLRTQMRTASLRPLSDELGRLRAELLRLKGELAGSPAAGWPVPPPVTAPGPAAPPTVPLAPQLSNVVSRLGPSPDRGRETNDPAHSLNSDPQP